MYKYIITIKEVNRPKPIVTSFSGKKMTNQDLIDFFGLENSDVESYSIKEVKI